MLCGGGKLICLLPFKVLPGWSYNQTDMRHSRKNYQIYYVSTYRGPLSIWDLKTHWAVKGYLPGLR